MTEAYPSVASEPTEVIFCIGSNCGDRQHNVALTLQWLEGLLIDFRRSPIYATPDCHGGQREYINAVVSGKSPLSQSELDMLCKEHEFACGRDAASRLAGDVPVDVDIVIYGGQLLRPKDFRCEFFQKGYRNLTL